MEVLQISEPDVDIAYGSGPGCRWFQLDVLRRRLGRLWPLDALAAPAVCPLLYGFGVPTRDLFHHLVSQVSIARLNIPERDRRWIDWHDWGMWLSGHCLLASRWMGHDASDEPAILTKHSIRMWHGLVRLRHHVIKVTLERIIDDGRELRWSYSALGCTCRRHSASWKAFKSRYFAALRDLKASHFLRPEPNALAFSACPWLGGEHRLNGWDFSNGFPPAIEEASLDVQAGHLRQLILDYRFAPLEEAHDHIRLLVDESLLQLMLSLVA